MSLYIKGDRSRIRLQYTQYCSMQIRGSTVLPPQYGTSEESSSGWNTQLEKGAVISQLGGRSLREVVEDGTDGPAGGPVDDRG